MKEENINFRIAVPYNHNMLASKRKKSKIAWGVFLLIVALASGVLAFLSAISGERAYVYLTFGVLFLICLPISIYKFCKLKPNANDDKKTIYFDFYSNTMMMHLDDGLGNEYARIYENCAYNDFNDKQYLKYVYETNDGFLLQIYTGTTNNYPNFNNRTIPKDVFESEENLEEFRNLIKNKYGIKYFDKQKNKQ